MTTRAKTFTALAAIATLGLTAFTTAQPAQAHQHNGHHHHHQTRRRGHSARRSGLRLLRSLRLLLDPSARVGWLGMASASRAYLRLE